MSHAKILIVEDEGIEALDIQHRLMGLGFPAPDIVLSGEEAVEKAGEIGPDLVLMDIMLNGEIDGITAAERIRARFDIPIVYLTAYADEDTLQRAKITEPYGYIVKPFEERELHIAIDMALYKHEMGRRLRESEKWLATTLRSIGDAVIATDKEGRITFMNPVAESLIGWKLEEISNKKLTEIFNIINRQTRRPVVNPVTRALLEGATMGLANHTLLIARDGTEVPIDDSAASIRDDRGNIIGVVLVFRDITEREKAEGALREQQEWLRVTLTSIGDAVMTTDTEGRITFVNPVAQTLTGWQMEEAEGRPVKEVFRIINEQTNEPGEDIVQRVLREGSIVTLANHTAIVTRGGRVTPIEDSAAPIKDTDGTMRGVVVVFHDVTEKRRAQQALRENEERLRLATESAQLGTWDFNPVTGELSFSERCKVIFGLPPDAHVDYGRFLDRVHPDDRQRIHELVQQALDPTGSGRYDAEYRSLSPNGSERWITAAGNAFFGSVDGHQRALRFIGTILDMTDRKKAEENLLREKTFSESAINSMPGVFYLFDEKGKFLRWNRNFEVVSGYSSQEISSMSPLDFFEPPHKGAIADAINRTFVEGSVIVEADFLSKNGRKTPHYFTGFRMAVDGVPYLVGEGIDITERKRAEGALFRAKEEWERTFASVPDMVAILNNNHRVLRVNEAMARRLGRKAEECVGMACYEAIHGLSSPPEFCPHCKTIEDGLEHIEEIHEDRLGGVFAVSTTPLLDNQGKMMGSVHVAHDITERKRAEKALRLAHHELEIRVEERTNELQQAYDKLKVETGEREQAESRLRQAQKMEALGTLTGGIAHDFNNILAAIIGFAEMAADEVPKESDTARSLQRVIQAGLRARDLVRRMLTFSRKTEQDKKPLQLSGIVKETMKLMRASIPTTISIAVDVRSETGLIMADLVQVQQVLMNLCTNAAQAMREKGGILQVELSDFTASASDTSHHGIKPGFYTKLVVHDTGTGISRDIIDKVFDPFFTTKEPGEGTGLGLSVVLGIVTQHNGYVTVESEPGRGSTFTVYFPKAAEELLNDAAVEQEIPTGSERVLFVDDEEPLAEMGKMLLERIGYRVTAATISSEALSMVRSDPHAFDLVITDVTMPELTGIELAREMMAIRADMPVILCTGFSHLIDADAARAAGIRAFAMKPLTKGEIARTIRQVLDANMEK